MIEELLISLAIGLATASFICLVGRRIERKLETDAQKYEILLRRLYVRGIKARQLAMLIYGGALVCFLVAWLAGGNLLLGLLAGVSAYFLPVWILDYSSARRLRRFDIQLLDAMSFLANNLRSGMSLPTAIEVLVDNSSAPLSEEFAFTMREYVRGRLLDEAFDAMLKRIPSRSLHLILMAMQICRKQGGNLAILLDSIGEDLRELHDIDTKVKAATAEGRMQAKALAASPLVLGAMMYLAQPETQSKFYGDIVGKVALVVAAVLSLLGFLWMKKIVNIKA